MHLARASALEPAGVAAAADAEDIEAPRTASEFRAAADGADFEGGDGDRDVEVAVLHLGGRDGVRALDDLRPSCPVARNIAATTLATWALNPRLAAFAEPTRFLRVLSSATASGVVCRRSSTTSRGIRTSAVTLRPRPSTTALMAAGFVGTEVAREGDERGGRLGFDDAADGLGGGDGGHVHPHRVLGVVAESQVHRVADDVRRHVEEFAVVRRPPRPSAPRSCRGSTRRAPRPRQRRRRGTPARGSSRT